MNHPIKEGYHRVLRDGQWIIALYEVTARGFGYWYIHGSRDEFGTSEFQQVDPEIVDPEPKTKQP